MKASASAYKLIREWEGLSLHPYDDGGGVWTVGYGSTTDVVLGEPISQAEAESRLEEDAHYAENCVNAQVSVPLTQPEFDALVCFVFNIGCLQFRKSTMLKLLNEGRYEQASAQFPRWNKDNGKVVAGLTNRRKAERALFESAG